MKIKKEDIVLIISGRDKNKKGRVLEVFPKQKRIVVEKINLRKKHVRPKKSGEKGQIITMPFAFDVSHYSVSILGARKKVNFPSFVC